MRSGQKFKHSVETLVLAYELHVSGISWHFITMYLGRGIRDAVWRACLNGIDTIRAEQFRNN